MPPKKDNDDDEGATEIFRRRQFNSMQKLLLGVAAIAPLLGAGWIGTKALVLIPIQIEDCQKMGTMNAAKITALELKSAELRDVSRTADTHTLRISTIETRVAESREMDAAIAAKIDALKSTLDQVAAEVREIRNRRTQ